MKPLRKLGGCLEGLGQPGGPGLEVRPSAGRWQRILARTGRAVKPTVLEDRILEDSVKDIGGSMAQGLET